MLPEPVQKQKPTKENTTRVLAAWSRGQRHTRTGGAGALRRAQLAPTFISLFLHL